MNKPHVKLNTNKQKEPTAKLVFNYGFGDDPREGLKEPDRRPMARNFRGYLRQFIRSYDERVAHRNSLLNIPEHIEYIQILFQSQFVISEFYNQWLNEFGLLGIHFSKFNNEVLFAISDRDKLNVFIKHIRSFISKELEQQADATYSGIIRFIKTFKLLTTQDIIRYNQAERLMNFQLIDDFALGNRLFNTIFQSLQKYLKLNGIAYHFDEDSRNLELQNIDEAHIVEIAQNFDIVLNITSSLATVIRPTAFNLPERSYGFEISNADEEDLPIIGIIDTGISDETPLTPILIDDDDYNLTGSSVFADNANHGTATAALAALGKRAYAMGYRGKIKADANLLSIKIMDSSSGPLSYRSVLDLLRKVKRDYPTIKIFVLTICYDIHKGTNEDFSSYAYELDKFAHESNCLVSICTANNNNAVGENNTYDLSYFLKEHTNICIPAESMNNITVGAAANSLRSGNFVGISTSREFPTLYSRKGHTDLHLLFDKRKVNKLYFKPDVLDCGGDYEYDPSGRYIGAGEKASMEVLSAINTEGFYPQVGTSFSAPLVANIAAQIQKMYPEIKAQSIKALIINGASLGLIRFPEAITPLHSKIAGYGLSSEQRSVYSNENQITFLLEDEIKPDEFRIFPINFPSYLITDNLGKKNGILKVTATLCFSFEPVLNHQLAYCPIHMAFNFFKNQTSKEIMDTDGAIKSLLKNNLRWSQNGRYVGKPIPYSNAQKVTFLVNRQDLINEKQVFKLAINCRINPQLLKGTEKPYEKAHPFSIVITIEENLKPEKLTDKLYSEMLACNENVNIASADLDAEGNAEAEA